jgi:hypothetical protein
MFGQQLGGLEAILQRPRPSIWGQLRRNPCLFLGRLIYESWLLRRTTPAQPLSNPVSVVCISDTHKYQPVLPHGDILIHAGDLTQSGSLAEVQAALDWLRSQPHRHKIVIAGNHDLLLDPSLDVHGPGVGGSAEEERARLDWGGLTYLQDAAAEVQCENGRRLRVYGSPRSCRHGNWAFQYPRSDGQTQWANAIPDDTDILVTHGPPRAHLDILSLGCTGLLDELWRVRPALHVFGHVHEGYGKEQVGFDFVQEAYEQVVVAGGGLWNLARLFTLFLRGWFLPLRESRCLLVNACTVGGLRDEKRREPISVSI